MTTKANACIDLMFTKMYAGAHGSIFTAVPHHHLTSFQILKSKDILVIKLNMKVDRVITLLLMKKGEMFSKLKFPTIILNVTIENQRIPCETSPIIINRF